MSLERSARGVLAVAAVAAGLVAAVPAEAAPRGGARYDGRSADKQRVFLEVRKGAKRLGDYAFSTRTRCSDGKRHRVVFVSEGERPVAIGDDGSFSYTSPNRRNGQTTFDGKFDDTGNKVTGSFRSTLRTRRYTCRTGEVAYSMNRDGTPGAPYRNARVASGRYEASGRSIALRMRPLLPGGFIHSLNVAYSTRCSSGQDYTWQHKVAVLALTRRATFAVELRGRAPVKPRRRATIRVRIAGRFRYENGAYRVRGAVRTANVVRRAGRRDPCRATLPFAGTFRAGPLGEEGPHPTG